MEQENFEKDEPNRLPDIIKFFGTSDRPVSQQEFRLFWLSLTDEEKQELRSSELIQ